VTTRRLAVAPGKVVQSAAWWLVADAAVPSENDGFVIRQSFPGRSRI
jgi:hypothetical protein